jgi:hypothetical protein
MSIADKVYDEVKLLPEPLAQEVLEFVQSLRNTRSDAEWRDLSLAQSASLRSVWDHSDDDVWDHV